MTATGPRVIVIGATHGDMVSFAVGADPARVAWGIETAHAARAAAGLDPKRLQPSAYVNVVVHDDPEMGRRLGEGGLSLFARFSAMHGTAVGSSTPEAKQTFERVHAAYDMTVHSRSQTPQAAILTSAFAREFGIFGRPAPCLERLRALIALGIERFVVVGPSRDADRTEIARAEQRLVEEVLPALRA